MSFISVCNCVLLANSRHCIFINYTLCIRNDSCTFATYLNLKKNPYLRGRGYPCLSASWVMLTWGLPHPEQKDRQNDIKKNYLPTTSFAGVKNILSQLYFSIIDTYIM